MCTDVALYALHANARIISLPLGLELEAYTRRCGALTSRMSLESMYGEWVVAPEVSAPRLMQVCGGLGCVVWARGCSG